MWPVLLVASPAWGDEKPAPVEAPIEVTSSQRPPPPAARDPEATPLRRGPAFAVFTGVGVAAFGASTTAQTDVRNETMMNVTGRLGGMVEDDVIVFGELAYFRSGEGDVTGFNVGIGGEYYLRRRLSLGGYAGMGYLSSPEMTSNFAFGVGATGAYEVLSRTRFAITLGARIHVETTQVLEGMEADEVAGTAAVFGFELGVRYFGGYDYKYAR